MSLKYIIGRYKFRIRVDIHLSQRHLRNKLMYLAEYYQIQYSLLELFKKKKKNKLVKNAISNNLDILIMLISKLVSYHGVNYVVN